MGSQQLIVRADAVRGFAKDLEHYGKVLDSESTRTIGRLSQLGETWRDSKYTAFSSEMKALDKEIKSARRRIEEYARHLRTFADRIDEAGAVKI